MNRAPTTRATRAARAVAHALTLERLAAVESPRQAAVSHDGTRVAFIRSAGPHRQVWVLPLDGGPLCQATFEFKDFQYPRWAPDDSALIAQADHELWRVNADGGRPLRLSAHPAALRDAQWSPDGRRIAVLSRREGWDHVWLLDAAGGSGVPPLRAVSAGRKRAGSVSDGPSPRIARRLSRRHVDLVQLRWAPDGRSVVAVEFPPAAMSCPRIVQIALPRGAERVLAEAPDCAQDQPALLPDGRTLLFRSDRDGRRHLWRLDLRSGETRALTRGAFVVDAFLPGADGRSILYERNADGCPRVHRLDLATGRVAAAADTAGMQRLVGFAGGRRAVIEGQSPWEPQDLFLVGFGDRAVRRLTDSRPAGFTRAAAVVPERWRGESRDGLPLAGWLYRPAMAAGAGTRRPSTRGRAPALVLAHGGPSWQNYFAWEPLWQYLALSGYALLAVDFRGSTGSTRDFWLANVGEWGHKDLFDCVDAARWLAGQRWVQPDRIGIMGGSYGGYLALCGAAFSPDVFRCAVDLFGDSDIAESYRRGDRTGRLDLLRTMGDPDDREKTALYRRGSPRFRAEDIRGPVLMLHGRKDLRVVPLMTDFMKEALSVESKFFEVHYYEDEGHGFQKPSNRWDSYRRIERFFERFLKGDGEERTE